jgi:hypothetical protein
MRAEAPGFKKGRKIPTNGDPRTAQIRAGHDRFGQAARRNSKRHPDQKIKHGRSLPQVQDLAPLQLFLNLLPREPRFEIEP